VPLLPCSMRVCCSASPLFWRANIYLVEYKLPQQIPSRQNLQEGAWIARESREQIANLKPQDSNRNNQIANQNSKIANSKPARARAPTPTPTPTHTHKHTHTHTHTHTHPHTPTHTPSITTAIIFFNFHTSARAPDHKRHMSRNHHKCDL